MPTSHQQRQKREAKRRERRAIKLHSTSLAVGHAAPLPEPPDFGVPRFTAEEQAANPGKPMTRRVKDFLRVGEWKEGFDSAGNPVFGKYDEAELKVILDNALAMMAAGDPINLGKSHGDDQMIIPTDELISPIDQVKLHNGVLWFSTYVTPAQAEYLDNPAIKVSAGMFPDYTAGNGTVYKGRTLLHVAATDRPVVGGQGPFIALSNYVAIAQTPAAPAQTVPADVSVETAKPGIFRPQLALQFKQRIAALRARRRGGPIRFASTMEGSGTMDFAALLNAINAILTGLGCAELPSDTSEQNIVGRLEGCALMIGGALKPAEGEGEGEGTIPVPMEGGGAPAMMSNLLRQVDARIAQANKPLADAMTKLTAALTAKTGEEAESAEAKFMKFYNSLGKAGVPEATLAPKLSIAKKIGFDCAILEGLHPTIKLSNLVSAAGATAEPPKEENASGMLTDEQVAARIKARGGKVDNMPKAGV